MATVGVLRFGVWFPRMCHAARRILARPDRWRDCGRPTTPPCATAVLLFRSCRCPVCRHSAYGYDTGRRTLHDLGDLLSGRPLDLLIRYSKHRCDRCRRRFTADLFDLADRGSHSIGRVVRVVVRLVVEDGLPYRSASWHLWRDQWRDHRVFGPHTTVQNWVKAGGKSRRAG